MRAVARALRDLTSIRSAVGRVLAESVKPIPGPKGGYRVAGQKLIDAIARHDSGGYGPQSVERVFRHCAIALGDIEIRATSWQPSDRRPASVEVRLRARVGRAGSSRSSSRWRS